MIEIPASFRIFGFGENTKPAIDQLNRKKYDGVERMAVLLYINPDSVKTDSDE